MILQKLKTPLSLIAAVLTAAFFIPIHSLASSTGSASYEVLCRGADPNGGPEWITQKLSLMSGWTSHSSWWPVHYDTSTGQILYCIQPGVPSSYSGDFTVEEGDDFWQEYPDDLNVTLDTDDMQRLLSLVLRYGFSGTLQEVWGTDSTPALSTDPTAARNMASHYATQLLVWETVVGERDAGFNKINAHDYGVSNVLEVINVNHPLYSQIIAQYESLEAKVKNHHAFPSFCGTDIDTAPVYDMEYDLTSGTCSLVLTDSNDSLSDMSFSADNPDISFSSTGSSLTVASTSPVQDVLVTGTTSGRYTVSSLVWTDYVYGPDDANEQDLIQIGIEIPDNLSVYFKLKVSAGNIRIVKTVDGDGGTLSGWQFKITSVDGTEIPGSPFTTGEDGSILTGSLPPGTYTVEEIISPSSLWECTTDNPRTVTVSSGEMVSVTFTNALRPGSITVNKVNYEDTPLAGAVFLLEWSDDGGDTWQPVSFSETIVHGGCSSQGLKDGTLTTPEDGIVSFTGLDPRLTYRLTETQAPRGYVLLSEPVWAGSLSDTPDLNLQFTVHNGRGYILPAAGGNGTSLYLFPVLGTALCTTSISMIIRRKKYEQ